MSPYLSMKEAAQVLGISLPSAYRWVATGRLRWVKNSALGRPQTVVRRADVEALRKLVTPAKRV